MATPLTRARIGEDRAPVEPDLAPDPRCELAIVEGRRILPDRVPVRDLRDAIDVGGVRAEENFGDQEVGPLAGREIQTVGEGDYQDYNTS